MTNTILQKICFIVAFVFSVSSVKGAESLSPGLNPSQRPDEIRKLIQETAAHYAQVKPLENKKDSTDTRDTGTRWNFNGTDFMGIRLIDADDFTKFLIKTAPPEQKDFYLLDIGAGDFSWAKKMAKYLNQQQDLAEGITIHIVSVTGEDYGPFVMEEMGRCKIYNIGKFAIENMNENFEKLGFHFDGIFDLIVSRYTFIHLHDPVGTFVQACNLLKPKRGFMMLDWIPVLFENDISKGKKSYLQIDNANKALVRLLEMTKYPYLITQGSMGNSISFILWRSDEHSVAPPLSYKGTIGLTPFNSFKKQTTYFAVTEPEHVLPEINWFDNHYTFLGDKNLYELIYKDYTPWHKINTRWKPLFQNDLTPTIEHLNVPLPPPAPPRNPIFDNFVEAIFENDFEKVKKLVQEGIDLTLKDPDSGESILLFTQPDNDMLDFLLDQNKVDVNERGKRQETLLFRYLISDKYLPEVKTLIKHGAAINIQDRFGKTPLHKAIQYDAAQIVQFLLENGADPSLQDSYGKTPLDHKNAQKSPILEIIETYKERVAP